MGAAGKRDDLKIISFTLFLGRLAKSWQAIEPLGSGFSGSSPAGYFLTSRFSSFALQYGLSGSNQEDKAYGKIASHYAIDLDMFWTYSIKSKTELPVELT